MKEVLEYTEEELEILSDDELRVLLSQAESGEMLFGTNQIVSKTLINSLYGALANKYFPLFNLEIGRAITGNGRYYIQKMSHYIEAELQRLIPSKDPYIIYNDTDSGYFQIDKFVEQAFKDKPQATIVEKTNFCDNFYQQVVDPVVQKSIDDFANELNAMNPSVIGCEREIIADKFLITAKKKYFARVIDSEGVRYNPFKMKIMGLDIIRSGTPPYVKKNLTDSLQILLDSQDAGDLIDWTEGVEAGFKTAPLVDISRVQGVSNTDYDLNTSKSIPIGARSALVHNRYIKQNNLMDKYDDIMPGDKIKQIYLQEPNPLSSNVVAYKNDSFIEIFKDYIDYDLCFQKYFMAPLEIMANPIGWDLKKNMESLTDW